jgi:amino acid transporter
MAARKFGVFGGVFTPAILTILGVIMYLRLPWIVGNGGLWVTFGVIFAAHVISVTTGLSVSSMATDKRVKAGGSYYILSRSLGLPIGGTLGLALFVGLSFSVSLYVIGFSESFLGYFGFEVSPANIRICGGTVLVLVTAVTLISTALALKAQYFIMTAIAISLVSVLVGSDAPAAAAPHLDPLPGGASLVVIFGIFFPAVTGFEAGVSMSGDLRDPNRDIPRGTLAAIAVGLVVYLSLAAFFAYRIPAEQLANNPKVLLEYAFMPELVLPGIWGATISSALGSILGAPRILQACAADRIGPRLFARGYGPDNEPRNALLLTFFIALSGILIGELDVIARVVTMFFMTSYGFLNLACAIESQVSPDFRPVFRLPRVIPISGALVSLILMTQLDLLGMLGATLVMGLLFLALRRRTLQLEGGDSWAGVWESAARWTLGKLRQTSTHERNWHPTLIAFSEPALSQDLGGSDFARFGAAEEMPRRRILDGERRWEERAAACRYHGLPGLEPNTVLLDLDDAIAEPAGFHRFFEDVRESGYVVLLHGGKGTVTRSRRIDAWTRGGGPNLSLQLALIRILMSRPRWSGAKVRFIAEVSSVTERRIIEYRLAGWLRGMRVQAEVKVLVEDRTRDQLALLSADADLTLLGMPVADDPQDMATRLAALRARVNDALFVHASPAFSDPLERMLAARGAAALEAAALPERKVDGLPEDPALAENPARFHQEVRGALEGFVADAVGAIQGQLDARVSAMEADLARDLSHLVHAAALTPPRRARVSAQVRRAMLEVTEAALDDIAGQLTETGRRLEAALSALDDGLAAAVLCLDEVVEVTLPQRSEDIPRAGAPGGGAVNRLLRRRRVRLRSETIRALATEAPAEVDAALQRGRAMIFRALLELDAWLGWTLSAADDLGAATAEEGAASLAGFQEKAASWRQARAAALEQELRAQAAFAVQLTQDVSERLVLPRRRLMRSGTPGGWIDAAELATQHAEAFSMLEMLLGRSRLDVQLRRALLQVEGGLRGAVARAREVLSSELLPALDAASEALAGALPAPPLRPRHADLGQQLQAILHQAIDDAVRALPSTIPVADDAALDALQRGELDELRPREVAAAQMAGILMETGCLEGMRAPIHGFDGAVQSAEDALAEAVRLLQADLAAAEADAWDPQHQELLRSGAERLEDARRSLEASLAALESRAAEVRLELAEQMTGTTIIGNAEQLGRFMRTRGRARLVSSLGGLSARTRDRAVELGVDLTYRWSSGVQAARELGAEGARLPIPELLAFRARVAPSLAVLEALPLPYRRAFLGSARASLSWEGHQRVLDEVQSALAWAESGRRGALMVTGAPGAGASSLISHIAANHLSQRPLVQLAPPPAATGEPAALVAALRAAAGVSASVPAEQALATLPREAVVIVPDLERWWLRCPEGLGAVELLCEWIERHGGRRLFILGCGRPSLLMLQRLTPLASLLLATATPPPLDARSLREVVMTRHRGTGLSLWLNERGEVPSEWQLARIFGAICDQSRGHIGPSLSTWVANITAVERDGLVIQRVAPDDTSALDKLPTPWIGALAALALHRRLTPEGLALSSGAADARLGSILTRTGLTTTTPSGVELDHFTGPHVVRWLERQGVIG